MTDLDVAIDDLVTVRQILSTYIPGVEVWAFGSRVAGRARRFSDLDLCLRSDFSIPVQVIAGLRDAFSASTLPFVVDIVVWADAKEDFRRIITKGHVIVQERSRGEP